MPENPWDAATFTLADACRERPSGEYLVLGLISIPCDRKQPTRAFRRKQVERQGGQSVSQIPEAQVPTRRVLSSPF